MVRLFVAVPLPAEIAAAGAALVASLPALRPVRPELMHLTLAFCGAVPDGRLGEATVAVETAAAAHLPFDAIADRVGRFPESGGPRVVWLGIGDGAAELGELAATVRAELARRALPFDAKPFRPHVTLARVRDGADRDDVRRITAALADARFARQRFAVSGILLLESRLSPQGPRYTPRAAVPLGVGSR